MVRHCIAYECKSRSTKEESNELSWHLLPLSNKELLRTWLIKIKRTNTPVSKNSYLGSKHFEEECFIKPLGGQRIRLKPVSVPSKFMFTVQRKERKRPCCRGEAMDTIKRTTSKKINFHGTTDDVAEDDRLEFCQPLDRTQPDEDFSVDHHEPEESREDELEAKISCLHDKINELEKLISCYISHQPPCQDLSFHLWPSWAGSYVFKPSSRICPNKNNHYLSFHCMRRDKGGLLTGCISSWAIFVFESPSEGNLNDLSLFRTFDFIKRVDKGRSQRCDKGLTLERQLCKSFTVIIRPLSTCLIKANFHVVLSHRRSTTVMVFQNSLAPMWIALGTRLTSEMPLS